MMRFNMRSLEDVAGELAAAHRASDPKTTTIKLFPSPQADEIRLVEITTAVPPTGEVLPFRFGADVTNRIDYPSVVILLNPDEWGEVQRGGLPLPTGWDLPSAIDL